MPSGKGVSMTKFDIISFLDSNAIAIPAIQRGYVHGEDTPKAKETLENFISRFWGLVSKPGEQNFNLDFTYGAEESGIAIPIDGQQRITTLWLTYLYCVHNFCPESEKEAHLSRLRRFSYSGRTSANAFCRELCQSSENYNAILRFNAITLGIDEHGEDPTISAMKRTLSALERSCKSLKQEATWENCFGALKRIVFEYVDIHDDLNKVSAEELYVKVNARGRTLTQWENLKGKVSDSDSSKKFKDEIEKLSDAYFSDFKEIPDNAFFSLFGRIADYVLRNEKPYDPDKHENLSVLAQGDDCYVPVEEFALERIAGRVVAPILRMLRWALSLDNNVKLWYWESGEESVARTLLAPKNNNDRDFALFLFEYFTKYEGGCGLCKNQHRSLRLVANILENVDRGRLMRHGEDGYRPENHFNRITYLKRLLENSDNLYDAQYKFSGDYPMQLNEELAKGEAYRNWTHDQIQLLQACESFMHGRVRIALLAAGYQERKWTSIAEREQQQSRLAALKNHLEEWYSNDDEQARIGFLKHIISCEPWNLIDQIMLSTKDDALRYLLSTRDDVYLQKTYLDNLTDESWGKEHHPWQRDWRKNVFELDVKVWKDRAVKWHSGTEVYFLYENTNITNAMPIADWRFEVREKIKEAFVEAEIGEVDSIRSNDQGTRCVISKLSDGRSVNIYLCKDGVWIRKQGSNGLGSPEQIIPINDPELKFDAFTLAVTIKEALLYIL